MRVIFSRKGFDSSAGGCPSPIIDGRPTSLPIPFDGPGELRYCDLPDPIPSIVSDLTGKRIDVRNKCHLDPDINSASLGKTRPRSWRGALGQIGAAQSHLNNHCVGAGDVFLFWGLFQDVERKVGRWRFVGRPHHRIFGWLEISEVHRVGADGSTLQKRHPWLVDHPHARPGWGESGSTNNNNTIYIAADRMTIWADAHLAGYGALKRGHVLTSESSTLKSVWNVPPWLDVRTKGTGMTYHPIKRWLGTGKLLSAGRGQEFIADIGSRPDALAWLRGVIGTG
ncbi:Nmad3 family putative nucleotide modification protein [Mesorhizobium sp. LNJC403B00]